MTKEKKPKWEKLNDKQIIKTIVVEDTLDTIFVIAPKNYKKIHVPLFCPLCEFAMTTKEDILEYKKEKMCEKCSCKWSNKKSLISDKNFKDSDEWQEYIEYREQMSRIILNLK
jgi:hypothetical protein